MKINVAIVGALTLGVVVTPMLGQETQESGYVSAMKTDLRQLATAEEAYFVDHAAYFSGPVSAAKPLYGFSPSRDVTINVTAPAGAPMWSAVASHARTQTKCTYQLPAPIECVSPVLPPAAPAAPSAVRAGDASTVDSANATIITIGDTKPVGIRAGQTRTWNFEIRGDRTQCLAMGQVETLSGGDRNVNVAIMAESDYKDWLANRPVRTDYESSERRVISFDVNINDAGHYVFVVSNRASRASKVIQLQHVTITCVE